MRWGILATGGIAAAFAADLATASNSGSAAGPDAEIVAVASRSRESAQAFAVGVPPARAKPRNSWRRRRSTTAS